MVEFYRVVLNGISLAINICLVYYAVRLMLIFREGRIGKAWKYLSTGVIALATSSSLFTLHYILPLLGEAIHPIAGTVMMMGGVLILIGMYTEHKSWTQPR